MLGLALLLMLAAACSKTEEPPRPVGNKLPYTGVTKSLSQLLDSIPEASIYRTALGRTQIQQYMDSLAANSSNAPYTLFVPTNKAFQAAGYTADNINTAPVAVLDSLIRYLIIPGGVAAGVTDMSGENTYYPLMYPDRDITRSQVPSPFQAAYNAYYYYRLIVGLSKGTLRLNGLPVSKAPAIPATNGALFLIDTLIVKPFYESYQVLSSDTSFSFYMAALKKSNTVYSENGTLGVFNDTSALVLAIGAYGESGRDPFAIVFAPENNAFRKAGFNSIDDINKYIDGSAAASGSWGATNMDSILVNHILYSWYNFNTNPGWSYLYSFDLRYGLYKINLSNSPAPGALFVQVNNGQVILHRQDAPSGRGAAIIGPSDITTLTGVIHRVDNLLLPTP